MTPEMLKVLGRVKKLFNLAQDSAASEGERDNALRMAHATLSKYNLSMAQVDTAGDLLNNDPRINTTFDLKADEAWARIAAQGVARLFFCYGYSVPLAEGGRRHVFVGKAMNVATAQYMAEYVINSIHREAEKAYASHKGLAKINLLLNLDGKTTPDAPKPTWMAAFCAEAAQIVRKRCKELADAAARQTEQTSTGTSMVLASFYKQEHDANVDYVKRVLGVELSNLKSKRYADIGSARMQGAAFGSSINLSQQIGNSASTTRRLK